MQVYPETVACNFKWEKENVFELVNIRLFRLYLLHYMHGNRVEIYKSEWFHDTRYKFASIVLLHFFVCIKISISCIWLIETVSCRLCNCVSKDFKEVLLDGFFSSLASLHSSRIVVLSCLVDSSNWCSSSFRSFSESDETFEV